MYPFIVTISGTPHFVSVEPEFQILFPPGGLPLTFLLFMVYWTQILSASVSLKKSFF